MLWHFAEYYQKPWQAYPDLPRSGSLPLLPPCRSASSPEVPHRVRLQSVPASWSDQYPPYPVQYPADSTLYFQKTLSKDPPVDSPSPEISAYIWRAPLPASPDENPAYSDTPPQK